MFLFSKSKYKKFSDNQLLDKYRSSNKQKYIAELFYRYAHLIYGVCLKFENKKSSCKDVVIIVFEKLISETKSKEIKFLKSWLYSVTRNECLQNNNKQAKSNIEDKSIVYYNSFEDNDKNISDDIVNSAVKKLKKEQRVCIELFYLNKKSYNQIVLETGYDLKSIKSYIQNGKRNLKTIIDKQINTNTIN